MPPEAAPVDAAGMPLPVINGARKPCLVIHCQYVYGIGHLARMKRLAAAAVRVFDVFLLSGGQPVPRHDVPEGVHQVQMPALYKREDEPLLTPVDPGQTLAHCLSARRALIEELIARLRPDVVVTEHFPFGLLFADEALHLLDVARRSNPRVVRVSSVRDVIESADGGPDGERSRELLDAHFDALLVHGDERLIPLEASFPQASALKVPYRHTGVITQAVKRSPRGAALPLVLGSVGGGRVGTELLDALSTAHGPLSARWPHRLVVFRGAFQAAAAATSGRVPTLEVRDFDEAAYLAHLAEADLLVCMGGYNTVYEGLSAQVPMLVYERAFLGGNREQSLRSRLLERHGLLGVLGPEDLATARLCEQLLQSVRRPARARPALDMDGARRSVELLATWARGHVGREGVSAGPVAPPAAPCFRR